MLWSRLKDSSTDKTDALLQPNHHSRWFMAEVQTCPSCGCIYLFRLICDRKADYNSRTNGDRMIYVFVLTPFLKYLFNHPNHKTPGRLHTCRLFLYDLITEMLSGLLDKCWMNLQSTCVRMCYVTQWLQLPVTVTTQVICLIPPKYVPEGIASLWKSSMNPGWFVNADSRPPLLRVYLCLTSVNSRQQKQKFTPRCRHMRSVWQRCHGNVV